MYCSMGVSPRGVSWCDMSGEWYPLFYFIDTTQSIIMKKILKRLTHVILVLLFFPFIHIITTGVVAWVAILIAPEHEQLVKTIGITYIVGVLFVWIAIFIWYGFDRMSQYEEKYEEHFLNN